MNSPGSLQKIRDEETPSFLHTLFEHSAAENFAAAAVVFGGHSITYKELNERAGRLSNAILRHAPAQDIIGISTTRSIEMIIGVLAILKSGKACLPLDPLYPDLRIKQIIADSSVSYCIAAGAEESFFAKFGLTLVEEKDGNEAMEAAAMRGLAYVLYTSGSTGKPKGVCMGHGALVNLVRWQQKRSAARPGSKTLQFAPLSFDVSFQEIFATLSTGGTLVLIENEVRTDPVRVLSIIQEENISRIFLPFVALQYLAETAVSSGVFPACLGEVITAGEQLKITPQVAAFFSGLPGCVLCNQYGPTECHVVTELQLTGDPAAWPPLPSIGKPVDAAEIFICDENLLPLPDGETGELIITGRCVAEGYLNQPAMTAEKFPAWDHPAGGRVKIYRTGDLAKYLPDGNIEFLGRRDSQVKIHGHRVEPGEIETALTRHPHIKQAVVTASGHQRDHNFLVAYFIANKNDVSISEIRSFVADILPAYMVPSYFIPMQEFPVTSSGKIDRLTLPTPDFKRPELHTLYKKPVTVIEKNIAGALQDILHLDRVGVNDNFFELGGDSLLAQKTVAVLKNKFKYILPVTKLYQFPTISGMAEFLQQSHAPAETRPAFARRDSSAQDVAVIGLAGRFPGADTIEEFWEVLKQGKETIRFFTTAELDASIPDTVKNSPDYIAARGIITDADKFDASFFELNTRLAELMDPQQRIFLEIAWEVLEKTGHLPQRYKGSTGVYAGTGNNTYYINNVFAHAELVNQVGAFQVMTVNEKDYVSSRTAFQLNLKGPAVSVYSACSTSLLAVAQAVEAIRKGQCDIAIAGGASVTSPINSGHLYQEGGMLSANGHCRSFDADASGTVFSDGAGVVLLKSLKAARADGDTIYAVIKGVGCNNDGGGKASFSSPSSEGQANAIAMAIHDAGFDPATIGYVETHGTATPIGDPIEIEGLRLAFGEQAKAQGCAIGSVKSNIGHLTAAAGIAGLIKTVLALHNRQIPPSLGCTSPNPNIDFKNTPFYVNTQLCDWASETIRRAGISSFGVGGTNVHLVLEEFENEAPVSSGGRPLQLVTWSAKSEPSLRGYASKLALFLQGNDDTCLADIGYTLQTTRPDFNYRAFALAHNNTVLAGKLMTGMPPSQMNMLKEAPAEVVFMFPGQGSQYVNMGRELYQNEPVYREAIDECAEILLPYTAIDIRKIIFPGDTEADAEEKLQNTRYTQPAIFITEYALAKLWMSWGITPSVFCGHSIGEFVAAYFAGIFTLPEALKLVALRGRMISEQPAGSMLAVRTNAETVAELMPGTLSIAAINSGKLCVVSGGHEEIARFSALLADRQIPARILRTSHAFHSWMMDPVIEEFEKIVQQVKLNIPRKPVISTLTGTWLTGSQATDPRYWSAHVRSTVLFAAATETILEQGNVVVLEAGAGNALATLVKQQAQKRNITVITSIDNTGADTTEYASMLKALGQLWMHGLQPDWAAFYSKQKRIRLNHLPTYSFDKRTCWLLPAAPAVSVVPAVQKMQDSPAGAPVFITRKESLVGRIMEILTNASGIDTANMPANSTFLEMGMDSLLMTQIALSLKTEFSVPLTFRQLFRELSTPALLAHYIDEKLPAAQLPAASFGQEYATPETVFAESNDASREKSRQANGQQDETADQVAPAGHSALSISTGSNALPPEHSTPPFPGARLGRDKEGRPGWYISDKNTPGKFIQVG